MIFAKHGPSKTFANLASEVEPATVAADILKLSDAGLAQAQYWVQHLERNLIEIGNNYKVISSNQKYKLQKSIDSLACIGTNEIHHIEKINILDSQVYFDFESPLAKDVVMTLFDNANISIFDESVRYYWENTLNHALKLIEKYSPAALPYIEKTLKWIVPMRCNIPKLTLSGTPENCRHIFAASWVPAKNFAETIIHECAHGALNEIMQASSLIANHMELHYSPFRDDLRPSIGLLHAQYSFHNICLLLADMRRDNHRVGEWAHEMLPTYLFDTYVCYHNMRDTNALTPSGARLSEEMNEDVLSLRSEMARNFDRELGEEKRRAFQRWYDNKSCQQDATRHREYFESAYALFFATSKSRPPKTVNKTLNHRKNFEGFGSNLGDWIQPCIINS